MADSRRRWFLAVAGAALLALPATASATEGWSGSTGPMPDAVTTTPAPPPDNLALIRYRGASARSASGARRIRCHGRVRLSLKRGAALLQRRTVSPDRRCHFSVTFRVTREVIGGATRLLVEERRGGRRTTRSIVRVPPAGSELLGSRGSDPEHQAPSALELYEPFRPPGLVPR